MLSNHARAVLRRSIIVAIPGFLMLPQVASGAAFTAGDLVVVRAAGGPNGDASAPLAGGGLAAAVFLDEYTTGGAFVQSVAMPSTSATSGNAALTLSGTQNIEGTITLSGDGKYLVMAGYNETANTAGVNTNGASSTLVARTIGVINWAAGTIDTTTALTDAMSTVSVRSAYSTNGTDLWVTGNGGGSVTINSVAVTTGGVKYATLGSTSSTQLNTAGLTTNNRIVMGFGNQLYVSNASTSGTTAPNKGVDTFGSIPTTTGQTLTSLPGFPAGNSAGEAADDFLFYNANTIYVADERAFVASTGATQAGGIQKWAFNSSTSNWELQYTLPVNGTFGAHGLASGTDGSGNPILYATTFNTAGAGITSLISITDTGSGSLPTLLSTSATNTAFRGVELIPAAAVPEPTSLGLLVAMAPLVMRRRAKK